MKFADLPVYSRKEMLRMKAKAMVLTDIKKLEIMEIDIREPEDDEVVVDVKACGVCGTDLHMFHGDKGAFENSLPLVMGHEFSGQVSAVGKNVKNFNIGDKVTVDPNMYCGHCRSCLKGQVHFCENMIGYGTTLYGGFSEKAVVKEKALYKLPDTISYLHGAMVEPLACCLHGIDRSNIRPGDTVAVIGLGSIGQMMMQLALCAGASRIVAIEPIAEKRNTAEKLGAYITIDPTKEDVKEACKKAGIEALDTVIECVGRINTMEMAVDIASNGATVMLFGLTPPESKITLLPLEQIFKKEIYITGSFINPLVSQRVIDLIAGGRINLDAVITDTIPIDNAVEVFENDEYRKHGKIVITF